jgi:hypothetical protein
MFINPIELLELQSYSASTISGTLIKKQKRKLFADIDLSDNGLFDYKGIELTKADCEKAIEDLENPDYLEFYLYLANDNQPLNDLLVNGDEGFFTGFKEESIYKLPEFVNFISPYFVPHFDKSLSHAVKHESLVDVQNILQTQNLINLSEQNTAFKSTSIIISDNINEIKEATEMIKNDETAWITANISGLTSSVKRWAPVNILNILPKYFQSQINKAADEINQLQLAIWKKLDKSYTCQVLLEHLLKLNIESVYKQQFEKNYEIVKADRWRRRIMIEASRRPEETEREKELKKIKKQTNKKVFLWSTGIYLGLSIICAALGGGELVGGLTMLFIIGWLISWLIDWFSK